jgi:hypothetical protein
MSMSRASYGLTEDADRGHRMCTVMFTVSGACAAVGMGSLLTNLVGGWHSHLDALLLVALYYAVLGTIERKVLRPCNGIPASEVANRRTRSSCMANTIAK